MKRRSLFAALLAAPAAFAAAMMPKAWKVTVVPFPKPVYSTILDVENERLVHRDKRTGLEITGAIHSGDMRIGGKPIRNYAEWEKVWESVNLI